MNLRFTAPEVDEPVLITVDEYEASGSKYISGFSDEPDSLKGHVYSFDAGLGLTLADLAQLVHRLQLYEAPKISAREWATIQRAGGKLVSESDEVTA